MSDLSSVSPSRLSFRLATPADAAALRALRLESLAAHPEAFGSDAATAARDSVEDWAAQLAERAASGEGVAAVAESEGRLVGMARLFRSLRPKTRHSGTLASVTCARLARRRVARGWWTFCRLGARSRRDVVKLAVVSTNVAAIRCYVRCGLASTAWSRRPSATRALPTTNCSSPPADPDGARGHVPDGVPEDEDECMPAYCGLVCETCPLYLATREPDAATREQMRVEIARLATSNTAGTWRRPRSATVTAARTEHGSLFPPARLRHTGLCPRARLRDLRRLPRLRL
jgi:hypothetical protein